MIGAAKRRYISAQIFSLASVRGTPPKGVRAATTRVVVDVNGDEHRDEDECVSIGTVGEGERATSS